MPVYARPVHGWIDATGVAAIILIGGYLIFALVVAFAVRNRIGTLSGLGAVIAVCLAMVGFTWPFAELVLQPFVKRSCSLTHSDKDCPFPGSNPCWRHNYKSDAAPTEKTTTSERKEKSKIFPSLRYED